MSFDKKDFSKPIPDGPLQHGFDYFYCNGSSLDMPPYVFIENNRFTEIPSATKKFPSFMYGPNAERGPVRPGPAAPGFEAAGRLPTPGPHAAAFSCKRRGAGTHVRPYPSFAR